jgi:hypothetical protein
MDPLRRWYSNQERLYDITICEVHPGRFCQVRNSTYTNQTCSLAYKTTGGKKIIIAINNYNEAINQKIILTGVGASEMIPYTTTVDKMLKQEQKFPSPIIFSTFHCPH